MAHFYLFIGIFLIIILSTYLIEYSDFVTHTTPAHLYV